jgi:hypothetical protein
VARRTATTGMVDSSPAASTGSPSSGWCMSLTSRIATAPAAAARLAFAENAVSRARDIGLLHGLFASFSAGPCRSTRTTLPLTSTPS